MRRLQADFLAGHWNMGWMSIAPVDVNHGGMTARLKCNPCFVAPVQTAIEADLIYANLHSTEYPAGIVRAQLATSMV